MENVKKFYETLAADTEMQERAKTLNDSKPDNEEAILTAIIGFAAKEGYTLTANEIKAYHEANAKIELPDDELDAAAGGEGLSCICTQTGTGDQDCGMVSILKWQENNCNIYAVLRRSW
jgi:predicted ribosomally synthesized peptide with nif11-like leader